VNNLAMNKSIDWFRNNVIYRVPSRFPGAGRKVYPGFLQHSGFVAMNPSNHANSHYDYFKNLIKGDGASTEAHRKFYNEYNAVLDMDSHYYLDTIKVVFQEFNLVNGTWDVKGLDGKVERVHPEDIKNTALFSIEGELDDISGSGQTAAVHSICSGVDEANQRHLEVEGAGHYGIFAGRRWREVVYPQVKAFILSYQPVTKAPEVPVAVAAPAPVLTAVAAPVIAPAQPVVDVPATPVAETQPKQSELVVTAPVKVKTPEAVQPAPVKAKPIVKTVAKVKPAAPPVVADVAPTPPLKIKATPKKAVSRK
jgi:poly(3-hydroxybutyrate) depolymerase